MSKDVVFKPSEKLSKKAWIDSLEKYKELYNYSIKNPDEFWGKISHQLSWFKNWDKVKSGSFLDVDFKFYEGGKLNASYNCLDRHIEKGFGDQTAIVWQGNGENEVIIYTYKQLLAEVEKFANVLKKFGVQKGDRVCLYMQMIPQLAIATLACSRIGAVHSIVFGAFSAEALKDRINDATCKIVVTQNYAVRGAKQNIAMKENVDKALHDTPSVETVIVVNRNGQDVAMENGRDFWWHEEMEKAEEHCAPEIMDAEDSLFILYTSGSTGKPKGVQHTTGGYLVYASYTHQMVFDYHPGEIYWCTADLGWITGHSYVLYGPLVNRATTIMFEGTLNYPDFGRYWSIIEKFKVNKFYTSPTALRSLMKEGDSFPQKYDLSSLQILGSVGEPIKEPEWYWYYNVIGKGNCPIMDTWWQTENGGFLISPFPGATPLKPGSATFPFLGIEPALVNENGEEIKEPNSSGYLVIKNPWPGITRTLYGDHERFKKTYFEKFPGYYLSGDEAYRDEDGYFWIVGRVDDVLNVSGHRIGTAEVENAIGKTIGVAEAAVVGCPHEIKGESIHAYVILMTEISGSDEMCKSILISVTEHIGPHAKPDKIFFVESLPKTRSGKIMRRILRNMSLGKTEFGDISTLEDSSLLGKK
ncbi:TPA: acetate--CoA ligase [Candidatus Dependentiae bacterium]|nr:MAG: Acetyl-coenzyme A synthetase [candidate division TM6 bacterium GW2011_GWE2_31_21]KKP53162.1 MAG: Acetyl-coenzyme A synthetase [candidate division TM6 bacterium GW2011_GWF2_33_332]HBS47981.1 acetate--CoA ligase [Candidatus Dependentiae bacterium]HBZ73415.1 acetate--CoA ligase [Candidatus Dependentiae bacterium]